jgi:hypothetical protein
MVKYPEFDKRERFGSSSSGETSAASPVAATPEEPIPVFSVVMLQHKGTVQGESDQKSGPRSI